MRLDGVTAGPYSDPDKYAEQQARADEDMERLAEHLDERRAEKARRA